MITEHTKVDKHEVVTSCADVTGEDQAVQPIDAALHTPDVVDAYRASLEVENVG
jgi:hypothetical protein